MNQITTEFACNNISIDEKDWNQSKQISEGFLQDHENSHLEQLTLKLLQIKIQFDAAGKPYTTRNVKERIMERKQSISCPYFCSYHNKSRDSQKY